MPTVPLYERNQSLRSAYQQDVDVRADAGDFGAAKGAAAESIGRGLQQLGQGVDNVGDAIARVQALEDENSAKDADNQYSEYLRQRSYGDGGFFTLEGKNAVDARDAFEQDAEDQRREFGKSLSPGAAAMYQQASTARLQSTLQQSIIHSATARKKWFNDSSTARTESFAQDALAAYQNPAQVNKSLAAGILELQNKGKMNGWDDDTLNNATGKYISGIRKGVAMRIAETDPVAANDYAKKFSKQLTGEDQYALDKALRDAVADEQAKRETQAILGMGRASKPPAGSSLNDSGPTNTRAFLAGKLSDKSRTEDVDGLSGNFASNLAAMMQDAPDNVKQGLGIQSGYRSTERQRQLYEASDKSGHMVAPPGQSNHEVGNAVDLGWNGQSFSSAPKDVQDWVHENAAKYGLYFPMNWEPWHVEPVGSRSNTVAPRNDNLASRTVFPSYQDIEDRLSQITDPKVQDLTRKRIYAQMEMQSRSDAANSKAARDQMWGVILKGGTPDQVPVEVKQAAGMEAVASAWSYVRQGDNRASDDVLLYKMRRYAATNPTEFASVDLNQYRDRLSSHDIDALTGVQTGILGNQQKAKSDGFTMASAYSQADQALEGVGITTTNLKGSARTDAAKRIAQFHNALTDQITEFKQAHPDQTPTQDDLHAMINRLLLPVVIKTPGTFWDSKQNGFAFEAGTRPDGSTVTPNVSYNDIPIDVRRAIAGRLETQLKRKPSEQEVAARYAEFILSR